MTTIIVQSTEPSVVTVQPVTESIVSVQPIIKSIVTAFPAGLKGDKGASVNAADFFQTLNKFSELDTEQKKADARANLGVQVFDCGEFF